MTLLAVLLGAGVLFIVVQLSATTILRELEQVKATLTRLELAVDKLSEDIQEISEDVERAAYSPAEREVRRFKRWPALTPERIAGLGVNEETRFRLLSGGLLTRLHYRHRELKYPPSDPKLSNSLWRGAA